MQADSGPIAGDRMIGSFSKQADRLVIHIEHIIHQGQEISADGVVTAPDTMEAAVASNIDQHYASNSFCPPPPPSSRGWGRHWRRRAIRRRFFRRSAAPRRTPI